MKSHKLLTILLFTCTIHGIAQQRSGYADINRSVVSVKTELGIGGGVIVGKLADSLYIITAKHVVEQSPNTIEVNLPGATAYRSGKAVLFPKSPEDDFALLSVHAPDFDFVPPGEVRKPDPNAPVFILKSSDSSGTIEMIPPNGEAIIRGMDSGKKLLYIYSNDINSGDSGSAVFEGISGGVIGIVLSGGKEAIIHVLQINHIREFIVRTMPRAWQLKIR